jgi:tetratricopeptide (TPR) repeat protein
MPVHEALVWHGEGEEDVATSDAFEVHHFPDESKSRGQYLPMLERAVRESPTEPRAAHYLGREYFFHKRYDEAIGELQRHLSLPGAIWSAQRGESCRLIGKCYQAMGRGAEATAWFWEAVRVHPERREAWVDLCYDLYSQADFAGGYFAASRALSIAERSTEYFSEPQAWGPLPHDVLSICAWHVGAVDQAIRQAQIALSFAPGNQRIKDNLAMFQQQRDGSPAVERSCSNATGGPSKSTTDDLARQRNLPT